MNNNNSLTAADMLARTELATLTGATASRIATKTSGIGISRVTTDVGTFTSVAVSPVAVVIVTVGAVAAFMLWWKSLKN